MRRSITVDEQTTIRATIGRIDRSDSGHVVLNEEDRPVGTVTAAGLRQELLDGVSPDAPVSSVLDGPATAPNAVRVADLTDGDTVDVGASDESGHELGTTPQGVETVLVVGGAGYVGSVLCRQLLDRGYKVRVLDPLLYGSAGVAELLDVDRFTLIESDARSVGPLLDAIDGADAVVHLGGIVGDPASEIDPRKTLEYNLHSTQLLASICKYHAINRFIFASTCSVYGRSETDSGRLSETASLNPVSLYARLKIQSERLLQEIADEHFSPTILRMATVYGHSPRMRFDLVGNILPAKAYTKGVIPVFGGDQYRPNVHVEDAARAYCHCLGAPLEDVGDAVFNVGSNRQNYRIDELATIVADCFPDASIEYHEDRTDDRSYRVAFDRIRGELGYDTRRTVRDHCLELKDAFESGVYDEHTATRYDNYETLDTAPSYEHTAPVLESPASAPVDRPRADVPSSEP